MKKLIYPSFFLFLFSFPLFAQIGGIENSVAEISDTIQIIFPNLLGVIFLVGFLFNTGPFFWCECRSETFSHTKMFIWMLHMTAKTIR